HTMIFYIGFITMAIVLINNGIAIFPLLPQVDVLAQTEPVPQWKLILAPTSLDELALANSSTYLRRSCFLRTIA
ncbi:MAG: hypothetical protein RR821_09880, partial [Clostridia bacterium]